MTALRPRFLFSSILLVLSQPCFAQSGSPGSVRAEAIRLLREGRKTATISLLEANLEVGKNRDSRDQAIAQEWLSVATYFYNLRDLQAAQTALIEATQIAAKFKQEKGADQNLYYFYRNVGTLVESIAQDRTLALDYFDLALRAASANPKVTAGEVGELRRTIARVQKDHAFAKSRGNR